MNNNNLKEMNVYVHQDYIAESPLEWESNLSKMIFFNKRNNLGDKHEYTDLEEFEESEEYRQVKETGIILPVYIYEHSGITIALNPFSCRWDSGILGYVYITKEVMEKEGITEEKAKEIIKEEIEMYDAYLTGNVFCIAFENLDGTKEEDLSHFIEYTNKPKEIIKELAKQCNIKINKVFEGIEKYIPKLVYTEVEI